MGENNKRGKKFNSDSADERNASQPKLNQGTNACTIFLILQEKSERFLTATGLGLADGPALAFLQPWKLFKSLIKNKNSLIIRLPV